MLAVSVFTILSSCYQHCLYSRLLFKELIKEWILLASMVPKKPCMANNYFSLCNPDSVFLPAFNSTRALLIASKVQLSAWLLAPFNFLPKGGYAIRIYTRSPSYVDLAVRCRFFEILPNSPQLLWAQYNTFATKKRCSLKSTSAFSVSNELHNSPLILRMRSSRGSTMQSERYRSIPHRSQQDLAVTSRYL